MTPLTEREKLIEDYQLMILPDLDDEMVSDLLANSQRRNTIDGHDC
jgi:hypothetical protein